MLIPGGCIKVGRTSGEPPAYLLTFNRVIPLLFSHTAWLDELLNLIHLGDPIRTSPDPLVTRTILG